MAMLSIILPLYGLFIASCTWKLLVVCSGRSSDFKEPTYSSFVNIFATHCKLSFTWKIGPMHLFNILSGPNRYGLSAGQLTPVRLEGKVR